jgi:hypothetical protein
MFYNMEKFDNYVFMTICETTSDLFKKSQFSTYRNYCKTLGLSLKSGVLDRKETADIIKITDVLVLIYGFDDWTCGEYIVKFFELDYERVTNFHKAVTLTKRYFALSFN